MRVALLLLAAAVGAQTPVVSGDAELTGLIGGKPLVIRTTARLAGAIDSVRWDGVEFIDSHDHGRQLQSAINADVDGVFHAECYNPTEAGSVVDALGPKTTSRLESISVRDGVLATRTRMAFWLAPGMKSHGHPAQNRELLSNHLLAKQVRIGRPGMDHVLEYRVTFTVPPDRPPAGQPAVGYGSFEFPVAKVVKWNCVFRVRQAEPIPAGDHAFRLFVVIGSREDCRRALVDLARESAGR